MTEVIISQPRELLFEWLNRRITLPRSEDFRAIGRTVDGHLRGVVGYTGHNGASCQMHMAGDDVRWASRRFISESFRYPFEICGYNIVFAAVPSGNARALEIDMKLGFKKLATIEGAHPDGALHFLMMRREDCRWMGG